MNARAAVLAFAVFVARSSLNFLVPYCRYSAPDKAHTSYDAGTGTIDLAFSQVEGYVPVWQSQITKRTAWGRVLLQEAGILVLAGAVLRLVRRRSPAANPAST